MVSFSKSKWDKAWIDTWYAFLLCYLFNCISVVLGPCSTNELIMGIQEYSEPDVISTCHSLTPREFQGYTVVHLSISGAVHNSTSSPRTANTFSSLQTSCWYLCPAHQRERHQKTPPVPGNCIKRALTVSWLSCPQWSPLRQYYNCLWQIDPLMFVPSVAQRHQSTHTCWKGLYHAADAHTERNN